MSGCSGSDRCPNCGASMDTYVDWKPYDISSGECLRCGFSYYTKEVFMSLEEVNERRKELELDPIDKLAEGSMKPPTKDDYLREVVGIMESQKLTMQDFVDALKKAKEVIYG